MQTCDSCGEQVLYAQDLYKRNERYDHGFAHGIGNSCGCVQRFLDAGYEKVALVCWQRDKLLDKLEAIEKVLHGEVDDD